MSENIVNEYQDFVKETYKYNFDNYNLMYLSNGMGGECGEVQNEVKKLYRVLQNQDLQKNNLLEIVQRKDNIKNELGDVLWYVFAIANQLQINISDVMKVNIEKNSKNKKI